MLIKILGRIKIIRFNLPQLQIDSTPVYNIIHEVNKIKTKDLLPLNIGSFKTYNPSMFKFNNDIYFIYRVSNSIGPGCPVKKSRTRLEPIYSFIAIQSPNGNITYIDCYDYLDKYCPLGYEDARGMVLHNKLYLIVNLRRHFPTSGKCGAVVYLLEIGDIYSLHYKGLIYPDREIELTTNFKLHYQEKNWSPFVYNHELYLVYSTSPHRILKCNIETGYSPEVYRTISSVPLFRGGTTIQKFRYKNKDIYLSFVHKRYNIVYYQTAMYAFEAEPPFKVISYTPEFIFEKNNISFVKHREKYFDIGIQFVAGFEIIKDSNGTYKFYITYGENDCDSILAVIDAEDIMKKLISVTHSSNNLIN